jgi:DNA-binding transcriptional LysR family regulator
VSDPARAPDPSLHALRTFHAVAQEGSFSRAAASLRVRQPAVSKIIQALEEEFGERLFTRRPSGVLLTARGAELLDACARLFGEVDAIARLRADASKSAPAELGVGTSDHIAAHILGGVVRDLRRSAPHLTTRIMTGAAHMFLPGLAAGSPEVGLFFSLPPSRSLDRMVVGRAPCQIVVRRDLADDEAVLTSFIGSREVDDLANKAFPTVRMLRERLPATRIVASCSSLTAHKSLVAQGVGISILPLFVVKDEIASGAFSVFHPEYVYIAELELVTKRGARPSPAAAAFTRALRAEIRALRLD